MPGGVSWPLSPTGKLLFARGFSQFSYFSFRLSVFLSFFLSFEAWNTVCEKVRMLHWKQCFWRTCTAIAFMHRKAKLDSNSRFRKQSDTSRSHEKKVELTDFSTARYTPVRFLLFRLFTTNLVNNTWDACLLELNIYSCWECRTHRLALNYIRTWNNSCW
jgi:hypothetical protein